MEQPDEQTIRKMDDILASQVAAGEVVERPASVIKELVENSIDAGAKALRVEILRGGIACIKVADNGRGMSRADLRVCLQRHATSKLKNFADLYCISQMGFRGEALPSIASVSHLRISTRRAQDVEGSLLVAHGGQEEEICATGCPPGTEIEVRDLFYNTPVRRKFLKSAETESGHIEHQLKLHALAFPDIRFTFLRDGQLVFDTPATHDTRQRIADFTGRDTALSLLRIRPTTHMGVHVEGFLTPLTEARRNKRMQFVFLNGRPIEDKIVTRAVRDGYGGFPTGLHPGLFLYLTIEPALVDVNVHPAKREVRFQRPADVTTAIICAISETLSNHARGAAAEPASPPPAAPVPPAPQAAAPAPAAAAPRPASANPASLPTRPAPTPPRAPELPPTTRTHLRLVSEPQQAVLPLPASPPPRRTAPPQPEPEPADDTPPFVLLGTVRGQYALFENADGLVLLSVRAARERILFERLMDTHRRHTVSQALLTPALVELDTRDMGLARELQPLFEQAGFHISAFGDKTLRIEAIPPYLALSKIEDFVAELLLTYSAGETRVKRHESPYRIFAVRLAHQYAKQENLQPWLRSPLPLLTDLLRCENPYCTARGKPTMLPFSMSEIQRKFQAQ